MQDTIVTTPVVSSPVATFSPVSCKDSFRIIMAFVAHYDLELHQMDVKMTFRVCSVL